MTGPDVPAIEAAHLNPCMMLPAHAFISCPPRPRMPMWFLAVPSLLSLVLQGLTILQPVEALLLQGALLPSPSLGSSAVRRGCTHKAVTPLPPHFLPLSCLPISSAPTLVQATITSHWDNSYHISHTGLLSVFPAHHAISAPGPLHLLFPLPEAQRF